MQRACRYLAMGTSLLRRGVYIIHGSLGLESRGVVAWVIYFSFVMNGGSDLVNESFFF